LSDASEIFKAKDSMSDNGIARDKDIMDKNFFSIGKESTKQEVELIKETVDVESMFELLGIKLRKGSRVPTSSNVLNVQSKVIKSLKNGVNLTELKAIAQSIDWILELDTDKEAHKQDRKDRAVAKIDQRVKDSGLKSNEEYIAYQIIEELNEVAEVLLRDNKKAKELLDIQKAVQKIVRFGPDTKIKDGKKVDSDGNPVYLKSKDGRVLTNKLRAEELITEANIAVNSTNTTDYLLLLNKEIQAIIKEEAGIIASSKEAEMAIPDEGC
jgi:hypothetical protein